VLGAVREAATPASANGLLQAVVVEQMDALFTSERIDTLARAICNGFSVVCRGMDLRAQVFDKSARSLVIEYMMTLVDSVDTEDAITIIQRLSPSLVNELRFSLNVFDIAFVTPYAWVHKGTCFNSQQDENESDIDCGGPSCQQCATGRSCRFDSDCQSHSCKGLICVAFNSANHVGVSVLFTVIAVSCIFFLFF